MRLSLAAALLLCACSGGSSEPPAPGPFTHQDLEGPSWVGYLSADKSVLVATWTRDLALHAYGVAVITRLGATFAQADLEGSYGFYRLVASAPSGAGGWACGRMAIDKAGLATVTSFITNMGPQPLPGQQSVTLDATGALLNPASATYHGVMGLKKDLTVRTETSSVYATLSISVK
jgi:hypothetical protein